MSGRLLLALDPRTSPPGRAGAAIGEPPGTPPQPPGIPQGLHRWDLARLCPPPDPPASLPHNNQSARFGIGSVLHYPSGASTEGSVTDPSAGQPREASARPVSLARELRSVKGGDTPSLPSGCQQLANLNGDDDDTADTALNWTQGAVHCSHAGLTAIPPLPINAQYL